MSPDFCAGGWRSSHEAMVQQFATDDDIFAIGIHRRNFDEDLAGLMKKKGLLAEPDAG